MAVPVSLIGTFGVMYLVGYSIDNLSLMALTISTGFVVDDAIVVIENITRYLEQGIPPFRAALKGASEIGSTVLTMSISLCAVFIPLLLMGGIVGRLFREFAVTLSVAILVSMVVSLTATPMMCAHLLKEDERHGWLYRVSERGFNWVVGRMAELLSVVLRHSFVTLWFCCAPWRLNVFLFVHVPKGFFPQQDNGRLSGQIIADQDTSFQAMNGILVRMVNIVAADPAVDAVNGFTGGTGGRGGASNTGTMFIGSSRPRNARSRPTCSSRGCGPNSRAFRAPLCSCSQPGYPRRRPEQRRAVSVHPAWRQPGRPGRLCAHVPGTPANPHHRRREQRSAGSGPASQTGDRPRHRQPFRHLAPVVDNALYDAFGQRQVSMMYTSAQPVSRGHGSGAPYRQIRRCCRISISCRRVGRPFRWLPSRISPRIRLPCRSTIRDCFPRSPSRSTWRREFRWETPTPSRKPSEHRLPSTIQTSFRAPRSVSRFPSNVPMLIPAAVAAVYMVLGILYESYVHPITILSTLPSAGVGALLALLTSNELNLIGMIGIILLIGLVKKNAIMMIDVALDIERNQGKKPAEAIYDACCSVSARS